MDYSTMTREELIKAMKKAHNGCPLFDGREKGSLDDLTEQIVTIEDVFKLTSDDGDYHAIIFEEDAAHTYLTSGGLKKLCDEFGEYAIGVKVKIKPMMKTKNKRDFRPIEIIG